MLIHGKQYLEVLKRALANTGTASMAVAFWGEGADCLFSGWHGKSLRIICNLASGGTNPSVIEKLLKIDNVEVRHLPDLHAKLFLTESQLIVGSANMSANGLGLEQDEMAGWREAGILSEDAANLQSAKTWFELQWGDAKPVTPDDMNAAKDAWKKRRVARPKPSAGNSLMEQPVQALKDRQIYLAVFRQYISPRARQELERVTLSIASEQPESDLANRLEVFEGWEERELPTDRNATLIQVYWGVRGKIVIHDVLRPVPELQSSYFDEDEQKTVMLDFFVKLKSVGPWSFVKADQLKLKEELRPWLEHNELKADAGYCISFYEFREWQISQDANKAGK